MDFGKPMGTITLQREIIESLLCTCGNGGPGSRGDQFITVDASNTECEPDKDGPWEGRWLCQTCGATWVDPEFNKERI